MSSTPPAQRQAASRAKKKAAGFTRITIRLDAQTTARLRRLAKRDGTPQAAAIAAGLYLLENKELMRDVREWVATQRAAKAAAGGR